MEINDIRDNLLGDIKVKGDEANDFAILWEGSADELPDWYDSVTINTIEAENSNVVIYVDYESYKDCKEEGDSES